MSSSVFKLRSNETNELIPDEMAAEYINNFFSSIGPNLAKNFKSPWNYTGSSYSTHFSITPFMPEDVVKLIKDIDISKSSAVDNLSSKILKDAFLALPTQITYLYNLSILQSSVPLAWKVALVTPLQKDGDPTDTNNLWPISHLPLPGKILERLIHSQVMNYLDQSFHTRYHSQIYR